MGGYGVQTLDRPQELKILKLKKKVTLGCNAAHHRQAVWHWARNLTPLILTSFLICKMPGKCYQDESRVSRGGAQ